MGPEVRITNYLIIFFIIFSLFLYKLTSAAEFYIANDGSDEHNNGSIEFPWASIEHAADNSGPGDTVYVRGGTYNENISLCCNDNHGGSEGNYWTLKPYQDEVVTFDRDSPFKVAAPYIIIENFHFRTKGIGLIMGGGYGYCCPYPGGAHHVIVRNNHFSGPGFKYAAISVYGRENIVENNTILDIKQTRTTDHGIYVHHGEHNIIRNNYIADARGSGIHIYTEYKSGNQGEDLTIKDMVIDGNVITNTGSAGIIVATGTTNSPLVKNNLIINNVIFDCGWSSKNHGIDIRGKSEDIFVYNNTIYNHTPLPEENDSSIHIGKHSSEQKTINNVFIKNNIIDAQVSEEDDYHVAISNQDHISNLSIERNLYWPSPMKLDDIYDDSPIQEDPQFENPSEGDFHLRSNSAAINVGLPLTEVATDKDGVTRPIGSDYDIGAYEYIDFIENPGNDNDRDNDNYDSIEYGGDDCNDQDPLVYPDAEEICDDEIDNDCDELIDQDDEDCSNEDTDDSNDDLDNNNNDDGEIECETSESIIDKDENLDVQGCGITTNNNIEKHNAELNILLVLVVFVIMGIIRSSFANMQLIRRSILSIL